MPISAFIYHATTGHPPEVVLSEVELVQAGDLVAFRQHNTIRTPYQFERLFDSREEARAWGAAEIEEHAAKVLAAATKLDGIPRSVSRVAAVESGVAAGQEASV
jgi:hypothetical protein